MEPPSGQAGETAGEPRSLPRQRWRLILARSPDAPDLGGRELANAWEQAMASSGLPLLHGASGSHARVAWAAPLPSRMAAERELAEIVLIEMLPAWRVRAALTSCLPAGWSLIDLHDVWLGAPALAGRVSGAVYRVSLDGDVDSAAVAAAASGLIEAKEVIRTRLKGGATVAYDLRPLLVAIEVIAAGPPIVLRLETRIHPERGSGRPEEAVAAMSDLLGCTLGCASIVRERLILADETG